MQLCVKKHPLWIRVLLTPQLQDLGDVVLRDATSVAWAPVYRLASCDFDPTPHVSSSVGAAEHRGRGAVPARRHGAGARGVPVERLHGLQPGGHQPRRGAGGKRQCEPLDTPHPVLSSK